MYLCAHHLLCINVHGLLQPAGNCLDDFNGCRTFYIAVLVQLIGDFCGEVDSANLFKQHGNLMQGVGSVLHSQI